MFNNRIKQRNRILRREQNWGKMNQFLELRKNIRVETRNNKQEMVEVVHQFEDRDKAGWSHN